MTDPKKTAEPRKTWSDENDRPGCVTCWLQVLALLFLFIPYVLYRLLLLLDRGRRMTETHYCPLTGDRPDYRDEITQILNWYLWDEMKRAAKNVTSDREWVRKILAADRGMAK